MVDSRLIESAIYSLADGLIIIDSTEHVAVWNPRAEELLLWQSVEMVGRRVDEMVERIAARTTMRDFVKTQLQSALNAPALSSSVELEILAGPPRIVAAQIFSLQGEGKSIGVGILLRDLTREREADAMKSQLLSTVSHELRTPLSSIKGFATTLLRQDVRWDEATQRDFLRIIEDETDRLTEIIDNLLDMSQIEAGALRVEREPTQLRMLIREVVDEMRMRTEAHWFVVDLPADLPRVMVDPRRIRQVLHNLLDNSIKYSKGGQITISCQVEGEWMVVSLTDQGEGIHPQFLEKIFDRFFQVDGAATRRKGGTGLGLSISRGIVEAHGGKIWAESIVGQGSAFRFTIPLAASEANS